MLRQTDFFALMMRMTTPGLSCIFVIDSCVCEECAPSLPVIRLLGRSNLGDSFGRDEDTACENILEIIFLGGILTWNYAAVCGGRMELDLF